jgi:hypothetical protein
MEYIEEEILDNEVPYVQVDYSKVVYDAPYEELMKCQAFFDNNEKVVEKLIEDKRVYTMTDCLTAFEVNEKRECQYPETVLEGQLMSVLTYQDWRNASDNLDIVRDEWIRNGARGALSEWPVPAKYEFTEGFNDYGKMHFLNLYNLSQVATRNKYVYEMYAYMLNLEFNIGRKLIWTRHWRAFKYILAFQSFDIVANYLKILRMCEDRYVQQYFNLLSIVFKWGLVFVYPYVELLKENIGAKVIKGDMIGMSPVLDSYGTGVNIGGTVPRIGVILDGVRVFVEFHLELCLPYLSSNDFVALSLVSKSYYRAVQTFISPFCEYTKYMGKFAYGTGMQRLSPIRRIHTMNGPYSGSYFGSQVYHETGDICHSCIEGDDVTGELNSFSSDAQLDRHIEGYNVEMYVDWSVIDWVGNIMEKLPMEYRVVYDKLFALTVGHFANIYDCCCASANAHETKLVEFYRKDYLFHMVLPFVPGALHWAWDKGYVIGQQWSFLNTPD